MEHKSYTLHIKARPWYEWLLWAFWLLISLFLLQNAIAGGQEHEPRAALIFWITFFIFQIGGAIVWFMRRNK